MKKALLVYYSFTGQTQRAVDLAAAELERAGFAPTRARVDFTDAALRLRRPLSPGTIKKWCDAAEGGQRLPIVVDPALALADRYDLVCLFSNTWQHHPCVPMRSLLALPEMQATLKDTPFAVYVVCRRLWENNLDIMRREAEQSGGRFVAGEHFEHHGGNIGSLLRTITYSLTSGGTVARLFGIRLPLPEYGLSDAAVARVGSFTRQLATSLDS